MADFPPLDALAFDIARRLQRGDLAERPETVAEREQGRHVVEEHRVEDAKSEQKRAGDADPVRPQDQLPASAHVALEVPGDVPEIEDAHEPLLHEHDLRGIGGDGGRPPQRDRDLGLLERDRVVDAVPDEADRAPLLLEQLDVVGLVRGQHLGEVSVHPEQLRQLAGRLLVVTRDDRQVVDSALPEPGHHLAHLRPVRGMELDAADDPAAGGHHDQGMALAVSLLHRTLELRRKVEPFHGHEARAADGHVRSSMPTVMP